MHTVTQIEEGDRRLLAQIAVAMKEAARRSGAWLACRPGCTQCCIGPFAITALDAWRLRRGLAELELADPDRAQRVRNRAAAYVELMAPLYPGDPVSGELKDEDALPPSMDSVPCPALDPNTGLCDLYAARPVTCRTFGPVTRVGEEDFGACEFCYQGATDEEKIRCAVEVDPEGWECALLEALAEGGAGGMTIVAYALVSGSRGREQTPPGSQV